MNRQPVLSSNVLSVGYDAERSLLEVEYQGGGVYRYRGVPADVHRTLLEARSLGAYLQHYVKGHFAFERVDPHDEAILTTVPAPAVRGHIAETDDPDLLEARHLLDELRQEWEERGELAERKRPADFEVVVDNVWEAVRLGHLQLQLRMIGDTHSLLVEAQKQMRGAVLEHANPDGKLDGLGLYQAQRGLQHIWENFFKDWQALFNQARYEAAALPFGALAVYHNQLFAPAVRQVEREQYERGERREPPAGLSELGEVDLDFPYLFDPQLRDVLNAADETIGGLRVSNRIWKLGNDGLNGIQNVLLNGVANQDSAWDIAKALQPFLGANEDCPRWTSTRLYKLTKEDIAGGDLTGLVRGEDCDGQGVSYYALRLARTELARVHAEATDHIMDGMPWIQDVRINLSPDHAKKDICDEKAGVHPKGEVKLPLHPQCLCFETAEEQSPKAFVKDLRAWMQGEPNADFDQYAASIGDRMAQPLRGGVFDVLGQALGLPPGADLGDVLYASSGPTPGNPSRDMELFNWHNREVQPLLKDFKNKYYRSQVEYANDAMRALLKRPGDPIGPVNEYLDRMLTSLNDPRQVARITAELGKADYDLSFELIKKMSDMPLTTDAQFAARKVVRTVLQQDLDGMRLAINDFKHLLGELPPPVPPPLPPVPPPVVPVRPIVPSGGFPVLSDADIISGKPPTAFAKMNGADLRQAIETRVSESNVQRNALQVQIDNLEHEYRHIYDPYYHPEATTERWDEIPYSATVRSRELQDQIKDLKLQRHNLDALLKNEIADNYLAVHEPINVKVTFGRNVGPKIMERMSEGAQEFSKLVSEDVARDFANTGGIDVYVREIARGERAYSNFNMGGAGGTVYLAEDSGMRTYVHEMGHLLESDYRVKTYANSFLSDRTQGEAAEWLGDSYARDEIAKKDKFFHPYVGKIYSSESTEVISMGLEYLWKDPLAFLHDDPEYFEFIVNVIRGTLI